MTSELRGTPRQRRRRWVTPVLVVLLLLAAGLVILRFTGGVLLERCTATAGDFTATVDTTQAANAATIAAVAERRGLPARATTIALATAMQESKLRNLNHGDRDSIGLFQQRPSQGWGTRAEILDPVYAAGKFYDALVKIDGYRTMNITDAAQRVQRSAYPQAYARHEPKARALASALMGHSHAAFTCGVRPGLHSREEAGPRGLTPRAAAVLDELQAAFGRQSTGGYAPGGVRSGHVNGSAHYDGRAVDVFFRPVNESNRREGWAVAHWLVANADRLGVATVIYDAKIWNSFRSREGWRTYTHPDGPTDNPTKLHLDHVHVDVIRGG